MKQTTLEVTDMSCDGCEATVIDALEALEGVSSATADRETDEVRVEHDEATVDEGTLENTVADAGYDAAV